jgi:NAD(P)-dependent dehydrogenase (short-subunit alcohol dehydrogenase family)
MILQGKTVIITGIGPGMGRKLALGAAAHGARVGLAARSVGFLNEVAGEITASGGEAIAVPCDVGSMADCENLVAKTVEAFGRVDGLVNSAYYHPDWTTFEGADLEQWAKAYDIACMGALRTIRAVLPHMKAQGSGAIVNISTLATRKPMVGEGGYAIAKAALSQVTRQLAVELGGYGIRVNQTVMGWMMGAPVQGYIDGMVASGRAEADVVGEIAGRIALKRIPPDQDCAKAVLFLLSDLASEVTGAALEVNGGEWVAP